MTRRNTLQCVHEPFGDAFYYGPERLGSRFEGDENAKEREESGFSESTFKTIMDRIEREGEDVSDASLHIFSVAGIAMVGGLEDFGKVFGHVKGRGTVTCQSCHGSPARARNPETKSCFFLATGECLDGAISHICRDCDHLVSTD
jgi:hypothetical protein